MADKPTLGELTIADNNISGQVGLHRSFEFVMTPVVMDDAGYTMHNWPYDHPLDLYGLKFQIKVNIDSGTWRKYTGTNLVYPSRSYIDARDAKRMAKTLQTIEAAMEKAAQADGNTDDPGVLALRFLRAIKATGMVRWSGSYYDWYKGGEVVNHITYEAQRYEREYRRCLEEAAELAVQAA